MGFNYAGMGSNCAGMESNYAGMGSNCAGMESNRVCKTLFEQFVDACNYLFCREFRA